MTSADNYWNYTVSLGIKTCPCWICYKRVLFQINTKNQPLLFTLSRQRRIWSFHVVVLQRTAKKCTENCNARAKPLFCSLKLLFGDVLVAVAVVFCVKSLLPVCLGTAAWLVESWVLNSYLRGGTTEPFKLCPTLRPRKSPRKLWFSYPNLYYIFLAIATRLTNLWNMA